MVSFGIHRRIVEAIPYLPLGFFVISRHGAEDSGHDGKSLSL
jgi:hypothetical protein